MGIVDFYINTSKNSQFTMRTFIVVVVAAIALQAVLAAPVTYCGTASDHLKNFRNATFNPSTVKPGQTINISFTGDLDEAVASGKVAINVLLNGVSLHTEVDDLCTAPVKCPIAQGAWTYQKATAIPSFAPTGNYEVMMKLLDQSNGAISCADVKFTIA